MSPSSGERGELSYHVHASERMVAITWYDNKPMENLSTACSPIDPSKSLYISWWHLDNHIEFPTSPVLVHYQNTCAELMCMISFVATTQFKGVTTSGGTKLCSISLISLF
jgi:hypothetical protein